MVVVDSEGADEVAQRIAAHLYAMGPQKLIRVEGFMGAGKTATASALAVALTGFRVSTDDPIEPSRKEKRERPYPDLLRRDWFERALSDAMAGSVPVILEGVCLEAVAPSSRWSRGSLLYVARYSFAVPDAPYWVGDPAYVPPALRPTGEPGLSVLRYHEEYRPQDRADILIRVGHNGRGACPMKESI